MMQHHIYLGDARAMPELADDAVHLIVTSPPYWQLKDYGSSDQLGYHDSYETYINDLNLVWQECARVLHSGCRLCINIGDQFARSSYYGRYKVIPIRTEIIRCCETLGLDYMGAIIWRKVTTCNTSGGASIMGSFPHPRNGILKLDYEFILIFKKQGPQPKVDKETKAAAAMTTEEWNDYFSGHWSFPGVKQGEHLAAFPIELPHRLIRMFSFPGETVLDPFLGSGTTIDAARRLGRCGVGYEINPDYLPVIRRRLGLDDDDLFSETPADTQITQAPPRNLEAARAALPYHFQDPLKVERKMDPKERRYGSRIDHAEQPKEQTLRVRDVIEPDRVLLNDGRTFRLAGIVPIVSQRDAAVQFLREQTLRQTVTVEADPALSSEGAEECGYLYLLNRTHLNLHLLKRGLALPDCSRSYRHRNRFDRFAPAQ